MEKRCIVCNKEFEAGNRAIRCKECQEEYRKEYKRQKNNEWAKNNPEKANKWRKDNPEKAKEIAKRWKRNNPIEWHLSRSKTMSKRNNRGFIPIAEIPNNVKNSPFGYEWKHFHRDTDYVIAVPRIGSSAYPRSYVYDFDNLIKNEYGYLEHSNPKLWAKIEALRKEALIKNKQIAQVIRHKRYIKQTEYPYHTFIEYDEVVVWS
jgi:hypothetical protein